MGETNKTDNWYKDGVRYGCTMCGKCCRANSKQDAKEKVISLTRVDISKIAKYLKMSQKAFQQKYLRKGYRETLVNFVELPDSSYACPFLDAAANRCTIYEVVPHQCQSWPFWAGAFESKEVWDSLTAISCEGVNHPEGRLISAEEITMKIKQKQTKAFEYCENIR